MLFYILKNNFAEVEKYWVLGRIILPVLWLLQHIGKPGRKPGTSQSSGTSRSALNRAKNFASALATRSLSSAEPFRNPFPCFGRFGLTVFGLSFGNKRAQQTMSSSGYLVNTTIERRFISLGRMMVSR